MDGRCTCGTVRFRLTDTPLCVHCCHCGWCRRETGSAFVLNALIETRKVALLDGAPVEVMTPSASGSGQVILRCPDCQVALWSHYSGAGRRFAFVRVGTLDDGASVVPDVHIFTESAVPWLPFPEGARVFPVFYDRKEVWSPEALDRRRAELARKE